VFGCWFASALRKNIQKPIENAADKICDCDNLHQILCKKERLNMLQYLGKTVSTVLYFE
jgi:hypothetical protein